MKAVRLTKAQRQLFENNFDRQAYDEAKKEVERLFSDWKTDEELLGTLRKYDWDMWGAEDYIFHYCVIEMDRSRMNTTADYVSVEFIIMCDYFDMHKFQIVDALLYSNEISKDYIADRLCHFDPNTCEVTKWLFKPGRKPIDN